MDFNIPATNRRIPECRAHVLNCFSLVVMANLHFGSVLSHWVLLWPSGGRWSKFTVRKEALAGTFKDQASGFICIFLYLPEHIVLFFELSWASPKSNMTLVFLDKSQSCLHHNDSKALKNWWPQFQIMQWFGRQKFIIRMRTKSQ